MVNSCRISASYLKGRSIGASDPHDGDAGEDFASCNQSGETSYCSEEKNMRTAGNIVLPFSICLEFLNLQMEP